MRDKGETHDSIAAALATWSGLSPKEHESHAYLIIAIDRGQIEKPKQVRERAQRIRTAASEIERAMSAMSPHETSILTSGILSSKHAPDKRPMSVPPYRSVVLAFVRSLRDGADALARVADRALLPHHGSHENMDLRRNIVAIKLGEIHAELQGDDPPRSGVDGPFQRLMKAVYHALGHPSTDLRAPLRAIHEFRKKRKSCT